MVLQKIFRNKQNWILGLLSSFIVLQGIASLPLLIIQYGHLWGFISDSFYKNSLFYVQTIAVQVIYELLLITVALIAAKYSKSSHKMWLKTEDMKASDALLLIFIFMGLGCILNLLTGVTLSALSNAGVPIPDYSAALPDPDGILQTVLYFFAVAVVPPICEEFIFRGVLCGSLKGISPVLAILVSGVTFGFLHGTLTQIPFAACVGFFLGYMYCRYNNIVLCIFMHFLNNFVSCLMGILTTKLNEDAAAALVLIVNSTEIILGIIGAIIFVLKNRKHRSTDTDVSGEASGDEYSRLPKARIPFHDALYATVTSFGFWLFILLSIVLTVSNYFTVLLAVG